MLINGVEKEVDAEVEAYIKKLEEKVSAYENLFESKLGQEITRIRTWCLDETMVLKREVVAIENTVGTLLQKLADKLIVKPPTQ